METKYDIRGRIIEEIDQTGNSTKYAYDNADHLISVTDSNGSIWTYDYDVQGNITCVTDPQGNKTSYTFDKMNRLVKNTLPMGMTATNTYDKYGYKTAYTDYNGDTTRYVYDEYYDIDKVIYADGTTTDYTYDQNRMLVQVDFNGQTIKYEYNELDGLKKKSLSDGTFVEYNYYDDGSLKSVTTNFGTTDYEYDILGRLTKVTDHNKGITVYEYDKAGNLVKSINPIGTTTEYIYDSVNRLLDETVTSANGEVLRKYSYTLDKVGRRTKVVESGKDISERTVQYSFDSLGRLEKETVTENGKTSTVSYTFDNLSNRISKNDNGTVIKYTYDANNRLLSEGNITYTYDKNGNTVTKTENGVTTTYTYFAFGRLKSVSDGTTTESYDYNYQGGRISKTTNGNTINYLLDDSGQVYNVLAEYDDALNATSIYTYGTDMVSIDNSGTVSYYLTDGQGSTRALTDENGIITDTYTYDAFGNVTSQTGDTYNPYLYNQEQYDANTGLYYLRARYMNPSTGRFISMDAYSGSIYDPMSLHKYMYANGNPVMYSDPTGYMSLASMATSTGIIGILTRAVVSGLCNVAFGRVIASIKSVQDGDYIKDKNDLFEALEDMREDFVEGEVTSVIFDAVVSPIAKAVAKTPVAQTVKNGVKNITKSVAYKVGNSNLFKKAADLTRNMVKQLADSEGCVKFGGVQVDDAINVADDVVNGGNNTINPQNINFMQNSIKNQTGSYTVLGNAEALKNGTLKASDLPEIRIWKDSEGKLWTLDHRRLAAFRIAGLDSVPFRWATDEEIANQMWKMTTKTNGRSIKLKLGNGESIVIE
jgi:RHS repeat-associated protein